MKKTQLKDIFRNVRKEIISFVSVAVIAMMAVVAYLGIHFSAAALKENADAYYKETHFRDFELLSTMLLTEEDIKTLRETEGIADVEGIYVANARVGTGSTFETLQVVSLSERLNTATLVEGRFPETAMECVLEVDLSITLGAGVGDQVTIEAEESASDYLEARTYTVTGIVKHADHYAKSEYVQGKRYALVLPEAFHLEELNGTYMKALIGLEKSEEMDLFSSAYKALSQSAYEALRPVARAMEASRDQRIHQEASEKIAEGEAELLEAARELEEGKAEIEESEAKLAEGEKALADGKRELDQAERELIAGDEELEATKAELDQARATLDEAKRQLDAGEAELAEAKRVLDRSKAELDDGKAQLDSTKQELEAGKSQLVDGYNAMEELKESIRSAVRDGIVKVGGEEALELFHFTDPYYIDDITGEEPSPYVISITRLVSLDFSTIDLDNLIHQGVTLLLENTRYESYREEAEAAILNNRGYQQIRGLYQERKDQVETWLKGRETYLSGLADYEKGLETYNASYEKYAAGLSEYESGRQTYEARLREYEEGLDAYEEGRRAYEEGLKKISDGWDAFNEKRLEYEQGLKDLEEGRKALEEGKLSYEKALKEYEDGRLKLEEAKERLATLDPCHYVLIPASSNGSYYHAETTANNLDKLSLTFALLFVAVGALVIYATIGRMVEDQRPLLGTVKALGLFNTEIFRKYLWFGLMGTFAGILLGVVLAVHFVERIVVALHASFYVKDTMSLAFSLGESLIIFGAGALLTFVSVLAATYSLLKQPARVLMVEDFPKGIKKSSAKSKKNHSLYTRLILRNIRSDLARVLVTMVSIIGCCMLLTIGFTLRNAINRSVDLYFSDVFMYDASISFTEATNERAGEEIEELLSESGGAYLSLYTGYRTIDIPGGMTNLFFCVTNSPRLSEFVQLKDLSGKAYEKVPEEGLLIYDRLAATLGLKAGDSLTVYDEAMNAFEIRIAGIFTNYFGQNVFLTPDTYEKVFGKRVADNAFFVNAPREGADDWLKNLSSELQHVEGFEKITDQGERERSFKSLTGGLNIVVVVLILAAVLMAYFVLMNLINMYLSKKKHEMTVMRINGFTTREVIRYVAGESVVTTVLGILIGLVGGSFVGDLIVRFLEQIHTGFVHEIAWGGCLLAAALTALFSAVINWIALRKVRDLKLSDMT